MDGPFPMSTVENVHKRNIGGGSFLKFVFYLRYLNLEMWNGRKEVEMILIWSWYVSSSIGAIMITKLTSLHLQNRGVTIWRYEMKENNWR